MLRAAMENPEVTGEVLRDYLPASGFSAPAIGPLFKRAQKAGWIVPTEEFKQSSLPANHAHFYRIWQSLLWEIFQ